VNIVIDAFGFFAPPPPAVNLTANPMSVPADGATTSAITATVTNGSGVAFDDAVTLTTTPSVAGSCGTATAPGSTNAEGQVTSTYTASTTPGTCTITATEANEGTMGTVIITQT
jgi:adhesin/invasin